MSKGYEIMRLLVHIKLKADLKANGYKRPYVAKLGLDDRGNISRTFKVLKDCYNNDHSFVIVEGHFLAQENEIVEIRNELGYIEWFMIKGSCTRVKVADMDHPEYISDVKRYLAGDLDAAELYKL
jgi:hypothetical protein